MKCIPSLDVEELSPSRVESSAVDNGNLQETNVHGSTQAKGGQEAEMD
jgi:hypothetical protein